MNYEEVESDQKRHLPSETDLPTDRHIDAVDEYRRNRSVLVTRDARDPEYLHELENKAIKVYEDGMEDDMDFKHRKSSADAVMELQGRKNKQTGGSSGPTIVFSNEAAANLTQGLAGLLAKDVTRYEDNKLAPKGNS